MTREKMLCVRKMWSEINTQKRRKWLYENVTCKNEKKKFDKKRNNLRESENKIG